MVTLTAAKNLLPGRPSEPEYGGIIVPDRVRR